MMDAFYTGHSRRAVLGSVADENMKPAVTSLAATVDVDTAEPHSRSDHFQTSAITNRSINLLPRICSRLNYEYFPLGKCEIFNGRP